MKIIKGRVLLTRNDTVGQYGYFGQRTWWSFLVRHTLIAFITDIVV